MKYLFHRRLFSGHYHAQWHPLTPVWERCWDCQDLMSLPWEHPRSLREYVIICEWSARHVSQLEHLRECGIRDQRLILPWSIKAEAQLSKIPYLLHPHKPAGCPKTLLSSAAVNQESMFWTRPSSELDGPALHSSKDIPVIHSHPKLCRTSIEGAWKLLIPSLS